MGAIWHCCHRRWRLDHLWLVQLWGVTVASVALELVVPVQKRSDQTIPFSHSSRRAILNSSSKKLFNSPSSQQVLNLPGQQQGDCGGGDMLGVPHVNQLAPLVIGQVPPGQAGELLVQGPAEQTQVVAHLSIGEIIMELKLDEKCLPRCRSYTAPHPRQRQRQGACPRTFSSSSGKDYERHQI